MVGHGDSGTVDQRVNGITGLDSCGFCVSCMRNSIKDAETDRKVVRFAGLVESNNRSD